MRDEDDGLAQAALEFEELVLHVAADERVQGAEGLVHQQEVGVGGQGPGEADSLLHAAGELVGPGHLPAFEPAQGQGLGGPAVALGAGHPLYLQPVAGVLQNVAVREESEVLEDHGYLRGPDAAQLARAERGEVLAAEEDASRGGLEQAVQHAQQGGLAGTRQPHDDEDLAGLDVEGDVDDRGRRSVGAQLGAVAAAFECAHGVIGPVSEHLVDVLGLER